MARNDWAALVTEPAAEYLAQSELERMGLHPYLPQLKRRWTAPHGRTRHLRNFPLFPRYILLPISDLQPQTIYLCRGIRKYHPILSDINGKPWRAFDIHIQQIRQAEQCNAFDDTLQKGEKVRINTGVLTGVHAFLENSSKNMLELFTPLLGGARVKLTQGDVSRAPET